MQAVGRHPRVARFLMWGNGFDGYRDDMTLSENLRSLGWTPDLIHVYKPDEHIGVVECTVPKVIDFNEAWWPDGRALDEVQRNRIDLVIHHHANDAQAFAGFDGPVVHLPHCAERSLFSLCPEESTTPFEARPISCLLTGAVSPDVYPLRARLQSLIDQGFLPGVVRCHPGYRLRDHATCERQFRNYAALLRQTKLVLACTSRYKYALAKLVEAMMSGCAVAGDLPDDPLFCKTLGPHVIAIDPRQSDRQIAERIQSWLARPQELSQRAAAGRAAALSAYTTEHYAEWYVATAADMLLESSGRQLIPTQAAARGVRRGIGGGRSGRSG